MTYPAAVGRWYSAFDQRDVVSLYPLDDQNFPVGGTITNNDSVRNQTDNRHGIVGYLNDPAVVAQILLGA